MQNVILMYTHIKTMIDNIKVTESDFPFKLICIDVDGTLLNSNHIISERTLKSLKFLKKKYGTSIVLASARMPDAVFNIRDRISNIDPIICYNGSLVLDSAKNEIYSKTINYSSIYKLTELIKKYNLNMCIYTHNKWYATNIDNFIEDEQKIVKVIPTVLNHDRILTHIYNNGYLAHKVLCINNPSNLAIIEKEIDLIENSEISFNYSKPTYLEIMPSNTNKIIALKGICKHLKIELSEVLSFGDGENDISLLKFSGFGVAMGNATNAVKSIAKAVTLSNDDDGIAAYIDSLICPK